MEYPIMRQSYNVNEQDSTIFSTNGCRVDTNDPLLYFFRFLDLQLKSAAAQF